MSDSSSISFSGLASGIDSASIITQLMKLESQPLTQMQSKQTTINGKASIFKQLQTALTSLQTLIAGMNSKNSLASTKSSSSDSSVASVSTSNTAQPGVHTLKVLTLAANQIQASQGFASSTDLNFNSGKLIVKHADGTSPIEITIPEGSNSLTGIAAAINAKSNSPVTASVVNTGDAANPYSLVLRGKDDQSYVLDTSLLTTAPAAPKGAPYAAPTLSEKVPPATARFELDGMEMTRSSNTITDAIDGVTINLLTAAADGSKTTTLTVSNDASAIVAKITSFVNSYNNIMDGIKSQSDYNATTKTAGTLSGNQTLRSLQSALQSVLITPVTDTSGTRLPDGMPTTLAEIGIKTDYLTGKLVLDNTKLTDALNSNYAATVNLFTQNSDKTGLKHGYGVFEKFRKTLDDYARSSTADPGILSITITSLTRQSRDIDDQMAALQKRLDAREKAYKAQYAAMETLVSSIKGTGNQLLSALATSSAVAASSSSSNS